MDVNDHDLCCKCTNHHFVRKSEVGPTPVMASFPNFYLVTSIDSEVKNKFCQFSKTLGNQDVLLLEKNIQFGFLLLQMDNKIILLNFVHTMK